MTRVRLILGETSGRITLVDEDVVASVHSPPGDNARAVGRDFEARQPLLRLADRACHRAAPIDPNDPGALDGVGGRF